jgi:hypothetical protein
MNHLKCKKYLFSLLFLSSFLYINEVFADKIISKPSYKLIAFENTEVTEVQESKVALDNRDNFNARSIYFELNNKAFVIFETIKDFDFSKVSLAIAFIDLSIPPQETIEKERKIQSYPLKFEDKFSGNSFTSLTGLVQTNDTSWLYITISEGFEGEAKILRAKLSGSSKIEELATINLDFSVVGGSWPSVHFFSGKYYLVYGKAKCCGLGYAMSDDGINFFEIDSLEKSGAMPAISHFSDGKMLYNYQRPYPTDTFNNKGNMEYVFKSRYKISDNDGLSWGHESIVTNSSLEVHDAFPFQRKDGNIDIYYSHGLNRKKTYWSLWRRCITSDGKLGKEQLLANELIGDITKPNVFRRSDGTIALLFVEQGENIKNGSVQYFSILQNDSVCQV